MTGEVRVTVHVRRCLVGMSLAVAVAATCLLLLVCMSQQTGPAFAEPHGASDKNARQLTAAVARLSAEVTANRTFTFALGSDAAGLDPSQVFDGNSILVTSQIYETLVNYEPGGTIPVPGLASDWTLSPDGRTWTFDLQQGVSFHDGNDLDAAAVVYNLNRWWDPDHPYHQENRWFSWIFGGLRGDPETRILAVDALGTHQVRLTLTQADSRVPSILAMPFLAIASPAAIRAGTLVTLPVGTGPFQFMRWVQGAQIDLAANEAHWDERPKVDALVFRVITDQASRFQALQSNEVHGAADLSWDYAVTAETDPALRVLWRPAVNVGYLGINRARPPLDDPLVREALAHAVDRQLLIEKHYVHADVANQLLPAAMWGHDPDLLDYTYDPPEARRLLALAGYTNGFTTTLMVLPVSRGYFPDPEPVGDGMQADLEAVGIDAALVTYDWGEYLAKLRNGEADLFMMGWHPDFLHPDQYFDPVLCAGQALGPRDDTLCDRLQDARAEPDFGAQLDIYHWAGRRVHDTSRLLPIVHTSWPLIVHRSVSGLVASAVAESFAYVDFSWTVYLPLLVRGFGR